MGLGWSLPWATPGERSPSSLPTGRPSLAPAAYTRASVPTPQSLLQAHLPPFCHKRGTHAGHRVTAPATLSSKDHLPTDPVGLAPPSGLSPDPLCAERPFLSPPI